MGLFSSVDRLVPLGLGTGGFPHIVDRLKYEAPASELVVALEGLTVASRELRGKHHAIPQPESTARSAEQLEAMRQYNLRRVAQLTAWGLRYQTMGDEAVAADKSVSTPESLTRDPGLLGSAVSALRTHIGQLDSLHDLQLDAADRAVLEQHVTGVAE